MSFYATNIVGVVLDFQEFDNLVQTIKRELMVSPDIADQLGTHQALDTILSTLNTKENNYNMSLLNLFINKTSQTSMYNTEFLAVIAPNNYYMNQEKFTHVIIGCLLSLIHFDCQELSQKLLDLDISTGILQQITMTSNKLAFVFPDKSTKLFNLMIKL
jgi:hypothetical protein